MRSLVRVPSVLVVAALLAACAKKEVPVVEMKGSCSDMNKSQVCTWVRTQGGNLVSAGMTVPIGAIENAPATEPMAWPPVPAARLNMPDSMRDKTGFTEMTSYWEPMGHPPGAYLTPHFDFHFYTISAEEQKAIDCKDLSKPAALAANYGLPDVPLPPDVAKMLGVSSLVGLCVPEMGMHSVLASELASTTTFNGAMVIGYYKGKPIFIEPMLSKAMLMEKKSFDLPIPTVPGLTGNYPRVFKANYDTQAQAYHFEFSGFAPGA
jgi:hypothetical protein